MDADEQVRTVFPGNLQALVKWDIVIPIPGQVGLIKPMPIQCLFQTLTDGQNNILFIRPPLPEWLPDRRRRDRGQ